MNSMLLPADLYAKFFVVAESRTSAPADMPPADTRVSTPTDGTSRAARPGRAFRRSPGLLPLAWLARFDLDL
jgi:hypothetical protein